MIILDYIKTASSHTVIVPPFHTGHLGFIPNTQVSVGIMAPWTKNASHCEVIVSPFQYDNGHLVRVSCTMRDAVGVVGRLIEAISSLGINIITLESSAINHLKHHTVNLLADLSTSELIRRTTKESTIKLYPKYESIFPLHDSRYVEIFESIVAHCADSMVWSSVLGRELPQVGISPLTNQTIKSKEWATIRSIKDIERSLLETIPENDRAYAYHVGIELPRNILLEVEKAVRRRANTPLRYILLSDTEERHLRIFFPIAQLVESLVHVGFYHTDQPGVLAEITGAAARSRFNIVTSLLRKVNASVSVWEAVLEYQGPKVEIPNQDNGEHICTWVAKLIKENAKNIGNLVNSDLEIGLPLYPRRPDAWKGRYQFRTEDSTSAVIEVEKEDIAHLLVERARAANKLKIGTLEGTRAPDLISLVQHSIQKGGRGKIFLSYPRVAERHAGLIRTHLSEHYDFDQYQRPDGEIILDEVQSKIADSDYFIGIWHHDESQPAGDGKFNISPWMPFEYGLALALKRKTMIIHSEKLDEKVWSESILGKRILDTLTSCSRKRLKQSS